jgi:hypothetical protein
MRRAGLLVILGFTTSFGVPKADNREVARIRNHFDSVLTELRVRDVSSLSAAQRANRQTLMVTLAAYRDRGVFPHNYDFPDAAMPYFIDRKTGTLCAVAHLLESTGRRDIVDRVARMNNNVWVAELASDTALATWLDRQGITLAEAARIQVPYIRNEPMTPAKVARNTMFFAVVPASAVVATTATVWNFVGNADGHRPGVSWSGVAAGSLTSTAGVLLMLRSYDTSDDSFKVGAAAVTLGGLSILTSSHSIYRHRVIAQREAESKKRVADAVVSPLVGFDQGNPSFGASLSLRF